MAQSVRQCSYQWIRYGIPEQAQRNDYTGDGSVEAEHLGVEQQDELRIGRFFNGVYSTARTIGESGAQARHGKSKSIAAVWAGRSGK